jgi:hypothetical protein
MAEVQGGPRFDLFISYARRDVRRRVGRGTIDVVALLKSELERHKRPKELPGAERHFRVCTDLDDFALDGSFDTVMHDRISRSECILLVASPNVAGSRYVQRELEILRRMNPRPLPIAAVLGASIATAAPDLFGDDTIAADLDQPEGTSLQEWRAALQRESHKIVARAWNLDPHKVFDRFEADRRSFRRQVLRAAVGVLLAAVGVLLAALVMLVGVLALIIGLSDDFGYYRATEIAMPKPILPAGVGFAEDGLIPIEVRERQALVWRHGLDQQPQEVELPFPVLQAIQAGPSRLAVSGLNDIAVVGFPDGSVLWRRTLPSKIQALAFGDDVLAASTEDGALTFFDQNGNGSAAPRPISQSGRRFLPAFRETKPFHYGEQLALNARFLASATNDGRLGILDRTTSQFVVAKTPQFPLVDPIEGAADPVLYETENIRPISALAFLPDGDLLFAEGADLRRVNPMNGELTMIEHCAIELVRQLLPLDDGVTIIALTSSTFEILRIDPRDRRRLECDQRTTFAAKLLTRGAMGADDRTVLIAFVNASPELWRPGYQIFGMVILLWW